MNNINHIAIIPDGNRRWATKNNIKLIDTYISSCDLIFEISSHLFKEIDSLNTLSLFFVSSENLKSRTKYELDSLFSAGNYFIEKYSPLIQNYDIGLKWIGINNHKPEDVNSPEFGNFLINAINCQNSIDQTSRTLNILVGYEVEKDINTALKNSSEFSIKNLEVKSKIDLIIRTGGYKRLSGFLPLNCLYSDFEFTPKLFPEVTTEDIFTSITNYRLVHKNFGK